MLWKRIILSARAWERVDTNVVIIREMDSFKTDINLSCIQIRFLRHSEHTPSALLDHQLPLFWEKIQCWL